MRPASLEMEGFGAFRERTVVDFSNAELVALVGRTGSGKSTIIDAITFALFGSVARYDDKKIVAPVINQTSNRARVQLQFELAGQCYTVARLVQRTKSGATTKEARLEHAGVVLAADARSVTAEVERLLGLDADQFNRTVVLPQGRFADFLHDQPRDRQAAIRNLLGLGVYQAIAGVARRRATTARTAADTLRPELDAGRERLSDARRAELVARHAAVAEARVAFIAALDEITTVTAEADEIGERLAELDGHLARLEGVAAPDGLAELDRRRTAAAGALAEATADVATARDRRRRADEAVAAGPDPVACAAQRDAHRVAAAAAAEHADTVVRLDQAETQAARAGAVAATIAAAQDELDFTAKAARATADEAHAAVAKAGTAAEIRHWLALRGRHGELSATITETTATLEAAAREVEERRRAVELAAAAECEARHRHEDVRERVGAAAFAKLLHVGEPCPLCLQDVDALPEHHVDQDLARASDVLDTATTAATTARAALATAEQEHARVDATLAADRRALAGLDADLSGVPDADELRGRLARVEQLQHALEQALTAARTADAAAAAHRDDPEHAAAVTAARTAEDAVTALRAVEGAQRIRRDDTARAVADLPSEAAVEAAIDEAARLAEDQHAAVAVLAGAEDALEQAMREQREVEVTTEDATAAVRAARDRLAVLDPPPLTGDGPAEAWDGLLTWAAAQQRELSADRTTLAARHEVVTERLAGLDHAARRLVHGLGGLDDSADRPLGSLRDDLAQAEMAAAAAVTSFDESRARLDALAARVAEHDDQAQVAGQLASLLRTDRFEAWVMEAALAELVDAASVRLRELTSGQFSLVLVDQAFMVRDHANADELRGARTLSGGETFLASLSLALALADATSEMAPEGSPTLESIFLDEGFGSLDPTTLDTVAAAIEELGSAGRMVVVVTHIRELAERLPVRLEVTKTPVSSSVERVDA